MDGRIWLLIILMVHEDTLTVMTGVELIILLLKVNGAKTSAVLFMEYILSSSFSLAAYIIKIKKSQFEQKYLQCYKIMTRHIVQR